MIDVVWNTRADAQLLCSGETETGMSRLSLSDSDKEARDWFHRTTTDLGCKVHVDAMGNHFAVRPGLNNDAPPTYAGSHLDTQPTGGRYDGILGVTAAVEMLKVLNDNWIETNCPVGVVNWTNEEGARFPKSMVCLIREFCPRTGHALTSFPLCRSHQVSGPALFPSHKPTTSNP